jgi:deazaflavin-dependent oxidoreductase (nitroreductase family)
MASLPDLEARVFRAVNRVLEPAIRSGTGSPGCLPAGLIVLEARGRKSGRRLRTPLVATRLGEHFLVSTFRGGRSNWIRNLAATPQARCWVGGKPRNVRAMVFTNTAGGRSIRLLPAPLAAALSALLPLTRVGWVFVVLEPLRAPGATVARPRVVRQAVRRAAHARA